jgi:3D (Asp-Asp-Asp) domain-containing protein
LRRPSGRFSPLLAVFLVAAIAAAPAAAAGGELDAVRARGETLRASARGALLELYAAQSALDGARAEESTLRARATALDAQATSARRRAGLLRRSAAAVQRRVHRTLRALYVDGDVDPVAVILGATSLDAAMEGIDSLRHATGRQRRLAAELRRASARVRRVRLVLAGRVKALEAARRDAAAATARLEVAVAARAATLADVRRRLDLTERQAGTLEARARAASAAAASIAAPPAARETAATPAPAPAAVPVAETPAVRPAPGTSRSLVVSAVAYHLPGRTASGLPVGVGVIAVDPRVIPLGTRVYVPGYGPAVAADVGSAVIGNVIDLWMPSATQARAWGRRTVSITVYG